MRAAVNSAIAASFGKDRGGFERFLDSILPKDGHVTHSAINQSAFAQFGIKPAEKIGTMDDWQEMK